MAQVIKPEHLDMLKEAGDRGVRGVEGAIDGIIESNKITDELGVEAIISSGEALKKTLESYMENVAMPIKNEAYRISDVLEQSMRTLQGKDA